MAAAFPTLAIIGGGFAGTTLAVQARTAWPEARILLFEPDEPGPGLAYSTPDPRHLLNVPATGMSLHPDQPGHFATWLAGQPDASPSGEGPCFAPRRLYGRYLREQFCAAVGEGVRHVPCRVTAVRPLPEGGFRLLAEDGTEHRAAHVVLALGGFASEAGSPPHLFGNPWDPAALKGLDPEAPVLMVGLGLTMVDLLLSLRGQGHRGPVLGISRHGWLPLPHVAGAFPPAWPIELPEGGALGPRALMRLLRQAARKAEAAGQPWQAVLDGMRPQVQRVWQGWDGMARRRFLRHARSAWNLHRHRVAPAIAAFLAAERDSGTLEVMAARLESWQPAQGGVEAVLRRRDGRRVSRRVARILLCTGPDSGGAWFRQPPVPALLEEGLAAPDDLGLGFAVRPEGQVLSRDGQPIPGLFALGPLTRSCLWEITAVPEIRTQASALLRRLALASGTRG